MGNEMVVVLRKLLERHRHTDLMAAVQNGGEFSLTTKNGYMSWWTGGAEGDANTARNGRI
ncbi:hypothetical protein [Chryseobacterium sp. Marseille-Q8038]